MPLCIDVNVSMCGHKCRCKHRHKCMYVCIVFSVYLYYKCVIYLCTYMCMCVLICTSMCTSTYTYAYNSLNYRLNLCLNSDLNLNINGLFFFFLLSVKHDFPNKKLFTLRKPLLYFYFLIRYQWIWLKGYSTEKLWPKVKDFEKNYLGTTSGAATLACIHLVYKMAAQLPASSS